MKNNKTIGILILVGVLLIGGYFGYKILTPSQETNTTETVSVFDIKKEDSTVILNGTVATPETKSFAYDYRTYGEYWNTHVYVGQYVEKDQLIIESSKKDYKAPFDGFIVGLNVNAAYVQSKRAYDDDQIVEVPEVLYTIASSDYYIDTTVTEYEITRLPENKYITFEVRADGQERKFEGTVRQLSGQPNISQGSDISTYNFTINMSDEAKYAVRLGNHVTVRIANRDEKPLLIPATSVFEQDGKKYVYVIEGENAITQKATLREITAETQENGEFKVLEGLIDGEKIAKANVEKITDGALVAIEAETINETTNQNA